MSSWRDIVAKENSNIDIIPSNETASPPAQENKSWRDLAASFTDKQLSPVSYDEAKKLTTTPYPEKRGETQAVKELPELGEMGGGGIVHKDNDGKLKWLVPTLLTTTNPREIGDILTKNFDYIGMQEDPGGNLLLANNETGDKVVINKPGISQTDILKLLGIGTAFFPASKLASIGTGLAAKVGLGAAAAGGTQYGIEKAQESMGGSLDKDEIALALVLGGASETIGPLIKRYKDARLAGDLDVARSELAEAIKKVNPSKAALSAIEDATGIKVGLFKGQKTMNPSSLLKQRLLPQLEAGAEVAAKRLQEQNESVFNATKELVDTISPPSAIISGSKNFRNAALKSIEKAKNNRRLLTEADYKEAFKSGADVNLDSVRSFIASELADSPPGSKLLKMLNKVDGVIGGEPTLRQLQKAKFEIDDMLEDVGSSALRKDNRRILTYIQKNLVDSMSEASPLYKAANSKFESLSPSVTNIEDILGSAANVSDDKLKLISKKIFDPSQTNPEVIKTARKLIDEADPTAWNDLMRVELQRRIGGMQTLVEDLPGELVGNVPAQLRRVIYGNPEQRRTFLSALRPEQRKNFVYLEDVLRRASAGRQAGSPTAPFQAAMDKMRGSAAALRDMVFRPIQSAQKVGEQGLFDRNVSRLTEVLFDPNWEPSLRKLRHMNPESNASFDLLKEILKPSPQALDSNNVK